MESTQSYSHIAVANFLVQVLCQGVVPAHNLHSVLHNVLIQPMSLIALLGEEPCLYGCALEVSFFCFDAVYTMP